MWISNDGVSPIHGSSKSFHVFSLRFESCMNAYPFTIFDPNPNIFKKHMLPYKLLYRRVMKQIDRVGKTIKVTLGDRKV